jgi:hypothetical protein
MYKENFLINGHFLAFSRVSQMQKITLETLDTLSTEPDQGWLVILDQSTSCEAA